MSNAATGNEQVQVLVFLNGWMPDEGESIQQPLRRKCLTTVPRRSRRPTPESESLGIAPASA
jgi:hypothetical protein